MHTRSVTLSMSTSSEAAPQVTDTEKAQIQAPLTKFIAILIAVAVGCTTFGGVWFTMRGDIIRQAAAIEAKGATIEANRLEAQKAIAELRAETKAQLGDLTTEQKSQRELLIRIDENIKRLPR